MKFLFILSFLLAGSAWACMDPGAHLVDTKGVFDAYSNNASYVACVKKLTKVGVKLQNTTVWRKQRAEGDDGPIIYSLMFSGTDRRDDRVRLRLDYSLRSHGFKCGRVDYNIPRGGSCF